MADGDPTYQRLLELEAKVAKLEQELKGHRKWHDAHQMQTHDERIAKLESLVKMLLEPHYH